MKSTTDSTDSTDSVLILTSAVMLQDAKAHVALIAVTQTTSTVLARMKVARAPAPMKIPVVLLLTVFSSITLLEPVPSTPIPTSSAG
jgi:hypothetical protein